MSHFTPATDGRYVLYARKSSESDEKQAKSIDQQIAECEQIAEKRGLKIVKVLVEKKSAHTGEARAQFANMLQMLETGEANGIIAWHPDRLARNMMDGGRLIEMLDRRIIEDMQFCTFHLTNDASGKMLLGFSFVISKNYSDNLSDSVSRSHRSLHGAGLAFGRTKHGYDTNEADQYIKGKYWNIIQQAWKKRLEGESQIDISAWVNEQGYRRVIKKHKKEQKMTPQKLGVIFKDPFYYGHYEMNGNAVFLPELYPFRPMVTQAEFLSIQKVQTNIKPLTEKERPLHRKIVHAENQSLVYAYNITKGQSGKRYLLYQVHNTKKRQNEHLRHRLKAIRGKDIVAALSELISRFKKPSKTVVEQIMAKEKELAQDTRKTHGMMLTNLRREKGRLMTKKDTLMEGYTVNGQGWEADEKAAYKKKKKQLTERIQQVKARIFEMEESEVHIVPQFDIVSNTLKTLSDSYKTLDGKSKLLIAEEIVSNFFIDNGKVQKIALKAPYDLLKIAKIPNGWG